MRFSGFDDRRNVNQKATDPRPVSRFDDAQQSGDAGKDGFDVLAKAEPGYSGKRPFVKGTEGIVPRGPDQSYEQ